MKHCHLEVDARTFLSILMACFLAFLSSALSSRERVCVEALGRSESLILSILSTCLAVRPLFSRTSRGMPVFWDTLIGLGCKQTHQLFISCWTFK